jgi:hypothetical protein
VDTPRPSPRTNRTRRVPRPVLIGPPGQTDEGRGSGWEGRGLVGTEIRQRRERGLAPRGVANAQQLQQRIQQPRPRREAVALFRAAERRVGDRRRRALLRRRRRARERRRERVRQEAGARELPRPAWGARDVAQARSCRLAGRRAAVEERARQRLAGLGGGALRALLLVVLLLLLPPAPRAIQKGSSVLGPGRSGAADLHGPRLGCERGGGAPVRVQSVRGRDEACAVSTGGGTRRVQLVREGGGGGAAARLSACRAARSSSAAPSWLGPAGGERLYISGPRGRGRGSHVTTERTKRRAGRQKWLKGAHRSGPRARRGGR